MRGKVEVTVRDQLLRRVLDECMEEQLSFVPPEREIARMHKFSPVFLASMAELLAEQSKKSEGKIRNLEKGEFVYGFNKIAACVLIFVLVGGVSVLGVSLFSPKGKSAMPEATESVMQEAKMEESAAETVTESASMEEAGNSKGSSIPSASFLDSVLKPAAIQKLPERFGKVEIVLNSPVIRPEAEEILVTIGNREEHAIRYSRAIELQVFVDDFWYVLPSGGEPEEGQPVVLEAGMAQDEMILLSDYSLDYDAEKYRVVVSLEDEMLCAEFTFGEELFEDKEEVE